jgi:lysozyme
VSSPQYADISSFQGTIDWAVYRKWAASFDGVARVAMKSTEGVGFTDPRFVANRAGALTAGVDLIMYYHYARPGLGNSAAAEADWQHQVVGALRPQDVLMLDYEENVDQATAAWALAWLARQEQNYGGALPTIYASTSYIGARLQDSRLARYPLTLANWTYDPAARPPCPAPWTSYAYLQYTDKATIPGIAVPVDANIALEGSRTPMKNWFDYPICVPFGDTHYDTALWAPHDMDVQASPNTPITALLPGTVVDVSSPSWGMQVGVKLDKPYNGIPYMAYLHLAAVKPGLLGTHVNTHDIIGWSGGATHADQYNGTSNPTGRNFLNDPSMSSQPQAGIALMRGPIYGSGAGWSTFPPIDRSLDPTQLILDARKGASMAGLPTGAHDDGATITFSNGKKIVKGFRAKYLELCNAGKVPPDDLALENERNVTQVEQSNPDWWQGSGSTQTTRYFRFGWSPAKGVQVTFIGQELLWYVKALADAQAAKPPVLPLPPAIPQVLIDDLKRIEADFAQALKDAGL